MTETELRELIRDVLTEEMGTEYAVKTYDDFYVKPDGNLTDDHEKAARFGDRYDAKDWGMEKGVQGFEVVEVPATRASVRDYQQGQMGRVDMANITSDQNLNEAPVEGDLLDKLNELERELRQWVKDVQDTRRTAGQLGFGNHFDRDVVQKATALEQDFIEMVQSIEKDL